MDIMCMYSVCYMYMKVVLSSCLQVVKLLLEHGSDPSLANDKELTPLDVCRNEEILQALTKAHGSLARPGQREPQGGSCDLNTESPTTAAQREQPPSALEKENKPKLAEEEVAEDSTMSEPEALVSSPLPPEARSASVEVQQRLQESTPSRARKRGRGKGSGFHLRGRVFSDVSSSESDSELLETARKLPKVMPSLPSAGEQGEEERSGEGRGREVEGERVEGREKGQEVGEDSRQRQEEQEGKSGEGGEEEVALEAGEEGREETKQGRDGGMAREVDEEVGPADSGYKDTVETTLPRTYILLHCTLPRTVRTYFYIVHVHVLYMYSV